MSTALTGRTALDIRVSEQELAENLNALELLSNQLDKYLPPQVYSSIFCGEQ